MIASTIELSEVTKTYGSTRAVDGMSVSFGRGVTGLLGPNGAGKTTLLRIIATVLAADSGTVRVLGEDPGEVSGRLSIRRRLGYFPQEPGYYANLSAFDFVDYIAILKEMTDRRARRDEVRRVLTEVGLDDVMHKRIKTLSGGMRRRVIVAQALLGDPELLVLDEPAVGPRPGAAAEVPRDGVGRGRAAHGAAVDAPDRRRGGALPAGGRRRPRPNPPRRHAGVPGRAGPRSRVARRPTGLVGAPVVANRIGPASAHRRPATPAPP